MKDVYTLEDLRQWQAATAGESHPIRLSVFGDPVAHSRSPQMHNPALESCGIPARYCRLHIRPEELAEALRLLPQANFIGTNLTIPHKAAALAMMDEVDEHARKIGVVNTVVVEGGRLLGFNTDGPGLSRAVRSEFGVDLRDLRVMVLGAGGGAGRAIATQCAIENCEKLILVNRTFEKARQLAHELEIFFKGARLLGPAPRLEAVPWEEAALAPRLTTTDLVINATSCGMKRTDPAVLPASILQPHLMVYDTIYTAHRTPLVAAAEEAGARAANGLSMLLFQGALSFERWFNQDAPLEVMRAGLLAL
ncbi:MAG: shikimate dehydrogenase [Verrucomicrobiota bacterium]